MPANGAVYIQEDKIDLFDVFEEVRSDKGLFRKASYYDVTLGDDIVRFNVMDKEAIPNHINGLLNYISSLDQDEKRIKDTSHIIKHTKIVLGLSTSKEFDENHLIWNSLFRIADKYNGYVFAYGSILMPEGNVLVGPLLDDNN